MDTRDFEACVELHSEALASFQPNVLVGSSFGGAVVAELLARELWCGPTLLLAQAALRRSPAQRLPPGLRVWLVHGTRDEVIDPQDSRRLAETGSADQVRLIEVDDDHSLHESIRNGMLLDCVRQLAGPPSANAARAPRAQRG